MSSIPENYYKQKTPTRLEARSLIESHIGPKLGISPGEFEKWYNVAIYLLLRHGGQKLLASQNYSILGLLRYVFPEFKWDPQRFPQVATPSVWDVPQNVRSYLEFLGESFQIREGDFLSWQKIKYQDFMKFGGQTLMRKYNYKLPVIFNVAFPEHKWDFVGFRRKPPDFWTNIDKQKEFILEIGVKLGINPGDYNAWYSVSYETLLALLGKKVFVETYESSRYKLFSTVFPEHTWVPALFKRLKRNIKSWPDAEIQDFAKHLEKGLGIKRANDWYSVTKRDVSALVSPYILRDQSDFLRFLERVYPNETWDVETLAWSSLGWSALRAMVEQLFPEKTVRLRDYSSDRSFERDLVKNSVVIPLFKLVFVYQGLGAYAEQIIQGRENLKRSDSTVLSQFCSLDGLTLISIPFWWNREKNSLLGEIFRKRKDLFEADGPLSGLIDGTQGLETIPETVPLPSNLNENYIRRWKDDSRYSELFLKRKTRPRKENEGKVKEEETRL